MSNNYFNEESIEACKNEALERIENIEVDETLDPIEQECVLRLIKTEMSDDCLIDINELQRYFIEQNYISGDSELKQTKREFNNVIMFFIASGLLEAASLGSFKMRVNLDQFNRAYKNIEAKKIIKIKK